MSRGALALVSDPDPESLPDEEVIGLILAGDTESYVILVSRYQDRLYRHALGMVFDSDVAADLVQEAFVKAYTGLRKCRDTSRFGTWITQILRNRCLDHLKERRRKDVPLDAHLDIALARGGPELDLERSRLRDALEEALGRLPEAHREAFLLKHVQGLSYEEMAEVVDASVSALRMRVMRARELLQTLMGEGRGVDEG